MAKVIILPPEPPLQTMMDHVFDRYRQLDTSCSTKGTLVDTKQCVNCCAGSYFGGRSVYECDNFRRVYLIKYLAVQVAQINLPIKVHLLGYIEEKAILSAISLGGGPGTEAIALMDNLRREDNYELTHDSIDSVISWKTMYEDITHFFAKQIKNVKLKNRFITCDLTSTTYDSGKLYDVIFISWILSQIEKQYMSRVLETARGLVKPGGYILVTDRPEETLVKNISAALDEIGGLSWIKKEGKATGHCGVTFPQDIQNTFQVRINCNSIYWLLQSS